MTARVLVVDDHLHNVKLLEARLQIAGYDVATAVTGLEALAIVGQFNPDLVLLDVMMPGMDGYEVCRRLRDGGAAPGLSIIMVTALDKPSDRQAALQAGADDFLIKPVEDAVLLSAISRALENAPEPRLAQAAAQRVQC